MARELPEDVLGPDGFLAGRFISPHARYTVAIDPGITRVLTDPRGITFSHEESRPEIAQFEQSGLRDHEIQTAFEAWTFSGLPEGINPVTRIGVYDPEAMAIASDWTDEQRKKVERKLWFESESHPADLRFVLSPRQPLPWPSYDSDSVDEILLFQQRLKVDPEVVRRYEEENLTRDEVISAMWDLEAAGERTEGAEVASVQA